MGKTKSDSFNPENRKVSDANSSLSDSAVETLAISYEDSYEAKLSANSKDQSSEDTEDSGSLIDPNSLTNSRKDAILL
ncbi:hypothetical protein CEXT_761591 [Caerostris extrusa]|uniref:Uncharacterized protein n=1 Tax=Caerostris extrusa TaxID=172846 RepID=A0AAV4UIT4_CAEEX|nr:hypothetical protein CEXT_761591 [Caerostris extrusa]